MDRESLLLALVKDALRETKGARSVATSVPSLRIDRLALLIRNAGFAEEAFVLVVSMLDQSRHEDRRYLGDLAEWLLLSPVVVRRILESNQSAAEIAA